MILDLCRFKNWLHDASLPEDARDTIEFLITDKERFEAEIATCDQEYDKLFQDLGKQTAETERVKKELEALKITKEPSKVSGRYVAQGNTYPHKELFKRFGFRWDSEKKLWYLTDVGKPTEEMVMQVRALLKEQEASAEVIYVAGT